MIQRSQRRRQSRAEPKQEDALRLHERLAVRRLWFLRLVSSSTIALLISFVLWLVRVPFTWHLLGIAAFFILGLFVRRPMKPWAITWIRERSGLSYETALEQAASTDSAAMPNTDTFGFAETLRQRASEETSRLAQPKYQAWWLPLLAVALGLAFLPLIPSVPNLPTAFTRQPPTLNTPTLSNQPANAVEPASPTASPSANEPTPSNESPSTPNSVTEASPLDGQAGSNTTATSDNQSANQEALGQFLDNLRQNEQTQESLPDLSSVMPQSSGNRQVSDEDQASRPRSEQTNPFAQAGENQTGQAQQNANQNAQNGEQGENQQSQGEQGQNQQGQNEQGQNEQGQTQSETGQGETGTEQSATGTDQAQTSEEQSSGEQSAGEQGQTEQGEQGQEGGDGQGISADGPGSDKSSDSGQNANGAGSLPGTPTGQASEVTGSSQQNPEFLQGQVSAGPNNTAGTVRLPGEMSQTVFPEGSAPSSFSRAEEEALTEGRIPLEYQEVIRNYFRGNNP
jgi:hypothetical protein